MLFGFAGAPTVVSPFVDTFWINSNALVFQAISTPPPGTLTTTLPLPANPGLAGLVVAWQAIAAGPATGFAESNPSLAVVH